MKIKRIFIDGYRSLKNFEIDNLNDINIFYGENNTGKSNITDALRLFFSEKEKTTIGEGETPYKFQGFLNIKRSDFYKNQEIPIKFEIELFLEKNDISRLKEIGGDDIEKPLLKKAGNKIKIIAEINSKLEDEKKGIGILSIKSLTIDDKETLITEKSRKLPNYRPLALSIQNYITNKFKLIDSSRQIVREISSGKKEVSVSEHNIQKYLYEISHSLNEKDHILFRKINNVFNELYEGNWDIEFSVEPEKPETIYDVIDKNGTKSIVEKINENNEIQIRMFSKNENLLLPIDNFGTGLKQSLIILTNIIANIDAEIFSIEELELNLSPSSQTKVFEKLLELKENEDFGVDQLFITTHSPVFENKKTSSCNVYMIELKDGKTTFQGMTPKLFVKHIKDSIPHYRLCETCDDLIKKSMQEIADKAKITIKEAEGLYEKNSQKLCNDCLKAKICDQTNKELIDFVAQQLSSYKSK